MSKSKKKCFGECFHQAATKSGYEKVYDCGENCKLSKCPNCEKSMPEWLLYCYHGFCLNCDMAGESGRKNIKNGNACEYCFGRLVPIGSSRQNGASHDDWDGRKMHKKCWLKWKRENED